MSQRDKGQKRFPEADLSRRRVIVAPNSPREEVVETTQRAARAASAAPQSQHSARRALRRQLGGRASLRQAIVLSEILGPPKALRGPADF
jgi:hypothetical protein